MDESLKIADESDVKSIYYYGMKSLSGDGDTFNSNLI